MSSSHLTYRHTVDEAGCYRGIVEQDGLEIWRSRQQYATADRAQRIAAQHALEMIRRGNAQALEHHPC